jgi:hypothetical protein
LEYAAADGAGDSLGMIFYKDFAPTVLAEELGGCGPQFRRLFERRRRGIFVEPKIENNFQAPSGAA